MNNDTSFPFQWSIRLPDEQIWVVRANTPSELGERVAIIQNRFLSPKTPAVPANQPSLTVLTGSNETTKPKVVSDICDICGAKATILSGISKTGNPYTIKKCQTYPEIVSNSKGVVGHSKFLR